jgi:hypothetical protein
MTASVPGGILGSRRRTKIASVMALGSRSPWGHFGEETKIACRHSPLGEFFWEAKNPLGGTHNPPLGKSLGTIFLFWGGY